MVMSMSELVIGKCMTLIKTNKPELNNTELEIIKYGLHGLYLSITKIIVLVVIAIVLKQINELLLLLLLFGILRSNAFGLHASKSWMCWLVTVPLFTIIPRIAMFITIPTYIKYICGVLFIIHIYKYAPSDTRKRPIVNKDIRKKHKLLATLTGAIYALVAIFTTNNLLGNMLIFSLLLINIFISPLTYKLFKLPYNNYLSYIEKKGGKIC